MLSFVFLCFLGMLVGIVVGLLPVLPIYFGPFLVYFLMNSYPIEHLLVFWISILIGSQFFGSVATITLGIPGESSSLVYLKDIAKMSLKEKNQLLFQTAKGSLVAGVIALCFLYFIVGYFKLSSFLFFTSINFQIVAYTFAVLSFVAFDKKYVISLCLVVLGILLGPKNNYVLPESWYKIQMFFEGTTLYMVVLAMMILPQIILYNADVFSKNESYTAEAKAEFSWRQSIKNTFLGMIAGLVPGPSSVLASTLSYKLQRGHVKEKIIAAETANNSAVIAALIPFFLLGLPLNQSAIIFSNIMDLKLINIPEIVLSHSSLFGVSIVAGICFCLLLITIIYYFLSINFIDKYIKFVSLLHKKMKLIMLAIVGAMVLVDMYVSEIAYFNYLLLLVGFSLFGLALEKLKVSAIPFMFAILLGDKLVWVYIQFFKINF